jgi:rod shape-determining protein MreC
MLELKGVPTRIELKPGTMIFTSGLGGTFPRGIAIGSVVQQLKTAEVWTHTYLLRPMVLPSRVNAVVVLTAQRVTQGTGNVWGAGAAINADSAARRIAAAGDSVAKQAALLQAQARQAALDSMKRATIDSVRRSLGAPVTPVDSAAQKAGQGGAQPAPAPGVQVPVRRDSIRPDATRPPRP